MVTQSEEGVTLGTMSLTLRFDHLEHLLGEFGLFEHARYRHPRLEHGFSLDDQGRALVVGARATKIGLDFPQEIIDRCGEFIASSHRLGWRDRRSDSGDWNHSATDDSIGRALWGAGEAAEVWPEGPWRQVLADSVGFHSRFWRANVYALSGWAACQLPDAPAEVTRLADELPPLGKGPWPWPEDRLTYDNPRLPAAWLLAGAASEKPELIERGLNALRWLVDVENGANGFSFTPVGGRGPGEFDSGFDQQPIECWAMADAALLAWQVTGDEIWRHVLGQAVSWLTGENDSGHVLYQSDTGGCCDGLTAGGVNLNQGCESTLAGLGVLLARESARLPVG